MDVRYYPPIVGFTGKAGAGKDTLAAYLVSTLHYVRYSCADPIKDLLNERFGWRPEYWNDRTWKEHPAMVHGSYQDSLLPTPFSPRSWAQWIGTEVGRNLAGEDVWIDALLAKAAANGHGKRCVIPDVRFNNEAKKIQDMGGIVIHVHRDVPGVIEHVSERGVDDMYIDYYVDNSGDVRVSTNTLQVVMDMWERDFGVNRA